jgi:methylmalonyl-CoA/ethylmalonyl-CoA epimerase
MTRRDARLAKKNIEVPPGRAVFDHVAIGTRALADGWELFGGVLGGTWLYGGDSPGFWWGQLGFLAGAKIELITPSGGPDSAFLERFLTARGPGTHHYNFLVTDIGETLALVRALGIEPVGVNLDGHRWKEAFLHPRDAHGVVIQVAQQSGPPPAPPPPAGLPTAGPPSALALIEHRVDDLAAATRLFEQVLGGTVTSSQDAAGGPAVELTWPGGARLRLSAARPASGPPMAHGGSAGPLHFSRAAGAYSQADLGRAAELSGRLGVALRLGG